MGSIYSAFSQDGLQDVLKPHFPTTNLNKPWQGLDLNPDLEESKNLQFCYRCILKHILNIAEGWPKSAIASCLIQIPLSECIPTPLNFLIPSSHHLCTEIYGDFYLDKHPKTEEMF